MSRKVPHYYSDYTQSVIMFESDRSYQAHEFVWAYSNGRFEIRQLLQYPENTKKELKLRHAFWLTRVIQRGLEKTRIFSIKTVALTTKHFM